MTGVQQPPGLVETAAVAPDHVLTVSQLLAVLSAIADGVTVHDTSFRLVYVNQAAARASGYDSAAEMMNAPVGDFLRRYELFDTDGAPFPPDQLPGRRVAAGAPHAEAVIRFRRRDTGADAWADVKARPVLGPDGSVEFVINVFHDITDLVRARTDAELARLRAQSLATASALLSSSLDYNTTLQSIAKLVVPGLADWCSVEVLDPDGALRTLAVAHVDPDKTRYARELRELHPVQLDAVAGAGAVLRTGRSELYPELKDEMLQRGAQSERHLALMRKLEMSSAMIVPLRVRDRTLGVINFVSSRPGWRYSEDDLRFAEELGRRAGVAVEHARLYGEAERARREAEAADHAKSGFLATISHEIRTPINAVVGYAQLLEMGTLSPEQAQQVGRIRASAQHLSRMVNDFLDWSKMEAGALEVGSEPASVAAAVESAVEAIRPAADARHLTIEVRGDARAKYLGDEQRVHQIVLNLLSNAVKFTPEHGAIRVEWRGDRVPPAASGLVGEQWITLSVADTGDGVPADKRASIFEPFRQGSQGYTRAREGTGLGLSISRRLARMMGGDVSVQSRADGASGAEFTLWLPGAR